MAGGCVGRTVKPASDCKTLDCALSGRVPFAACASGGKLGLEADEAGLFERAA